MEKKSVIIGEIVDIKTSGIRHHFGVNSTIGYLRLPLDKDLKNIVIENLEIIVRICVSYTYEPETNNEEVEKVLSIVPVNPEFIELDTIEFSDTRLLLNEEIKLNTSYKDTYYVFENKDFDVLSFAESYIEALNSFQEDFIFSYNRLTSINNDQLTEHARKIKKLYLNIVSQKEIIHAVKNKTA